MSFTECDVRVKLAELRETCRRIRKLNMILKTVDTHRYKEVNHLRVLEKLEAWRSHGFNGCNVYNGQWQPSGYERACSGDDQKHSQIDVDFHSRLPSTPEETTATMWAELHLLKQEIMLSQSPQPPSPQCDVPLR